MRPRRPAEQRFWEKVEKTNSCWLWTGTLSTGYGRFKVKSYTAVPAHRFAYELLVGPIPDGLVIDHLCRVRRCVNPGHMEPVTVRENTLRGTSPSALAAQRTHCPRGHPYDEINTWRKATGERRCRICTRAEGRRRRREAKQTSGRSG